MEKKLSELLGPVVDDLFERGILDEPFSKVAFLVDDVIIKIGIAGSDIANPLPAAKKNVKMPDMEPTYHSLGSRSGPKVSGAPKAPGGAKGAPKVKVPK